ncbi:hypothetical protein WJX74_001718 [Apatococcus lobatus]|uniref:Uncharacterized protein n=1 Tax=Apatococcus lobatus TaxID=904363 RepID=A0AAW1RKB3_9CHLO
MRLSAASAEATRSTSGTAATSSPVDGIEAGRGAQPAVPSGPAAASVLCLDKPIAEAEGCQPQVAAAVDNRQQQSTTPLPVKGGFQRYCSHHFNWKVGEPLPQCNRLFSSVVPAGILPGEGGG